VKVLLAKTEVRGGTTLDLIGSAIDNKYSVDALAHKIGTQHESKQLSF
jgi:hypothetical protein